jgi:hypothetical protein
MKPSYNNRYCQEIYNIIFPLLGELMTYNVLKFQIKNIGKTEDNITTSDLPALAEAVKNGLTIFLGSEASRNIATKILNIV